jgi:8-oxo-dGTP pyrophosphatase MutT (NUDIX family)
MPVQKKQNATRTLTAKDRVVQFGLVIAYWLASIFWFIFRPRTRGVNIAIWWHAKLLMIRNSYRKGYNLPGGNIKRGETLASAAVRELFEEIGLRIPRKRLRYAGRFTSRHEYKRDMVDFYEIDISEPPSLQIDNREVTWARFIDPDAIALEEIFPPVRQYLEARKKSRQSITIEHQGSVSQL